MENDDSLGLMDCPVISEKADHVYIIESCGSG
jgi:hypothetical protein